MKEAGNRRFVALSAEQGHKIQERGSLRVIAAPFGLGQIVRGTTGSEAAQRRQQQQAIGSYRQGWLTRHRVLAPHLRLAHSQNVFLIAMIYFDLPAIKASRYQQLGWGGQIGREKVSRLAIISTRVARELGAMTNKRRLRCPPPRFHNTPLTSLYFTRRRLPPR
jgi:hypothetical protein